MEVITLKSSRAESNPFQNTEHPLRVAAYCRVSTGDDSQQTSYTTQKQFYTQYIQQHSNWILAGIYADEAISGTSRAKREQFNRMLTDAKTGKIDYIITKSISRFARNTVDTLTCVRDLRNLTPSVGCYFEKENIDTLDSKGELILTILSALAQEESRSVSENIRWAIRKKFQRGEPIVDLKRMLGYDKGENGQWLINEEQAEIVRYIYEEYLQGVSARQIAFALNQKGITTVMGKQWRADAVLLILRNEKYVGDLMMQKTVTQDFLTHKSLENEGLAPKYYIKDHHPAIIPRDVFDQIQQRFRNQKTKRRTAENMRGKPKHSLWGLRFSDAQGVMHTLHRCSYTTTVAGYTDYRSIAIRGLNPERLSERYYFSYPVWKADATIPGLNRKALSELAIQQSFMEMLYRLKAEYTQQGESSSLCKVFQAFVVQLDSVNPLSSDALRKIFAEFIMQLQKLPDANAAGKPLVICGLNEEIGTPDLLPFHRDIYETFVSNALVKGDSIIYEMAFGLKLTSYGNARTLEDFLGFRRINHGGREEILDALWKLSEKPICYHCREVKWTRPDLRKG